MAIKSTKCRLCNEHLICNGELALKNEVSRHFIANHPEKLEEWNVYYQEILASIIRERQKLLEKALELVDDAELLVNSFT